MINVIFVEHGGAKHTVNVELDETLMAAALRTGVPGIDADCGGNCSCATCHVIVHPDWAPRIGPPNEAEAGMLELTPERTETSRLACQIRISPSYEGLEVRIPQYQM